MHVDAPPPSPSTAIGRIILGSFLSALAGWATLTLFPLGAFLLQTDNFPGGELSSSFAMPLVAGFFVLPVWFVELLPLYCLVPSRSVLWRWPVCTVCGAVAGSAIMLVFYAVASGHYVDSLPLVSLAALVGATTCLFGSLTRRWFRFPAGA